MAFIIPGLRFITLIPEVSDSWDRKTNLGGGKNGFGILSSQARVMVVENNNGQSVAARGDEGAKQPWQLDVSILKVQNTSSQSTGWGCKVIILHLASIHETVSETWPYFLFGSSIAQKYKIHQVTLLILGVDFFPEDWQHIVHCFIKSHMAPFLIAENDIRVLWAQFSQRNPIRNHRTYFKSGVNVTA